MGERITGLGRGLVTGVVAGVVWTALEAVLAWWSGSVVPQPVIVTLAAANLAVACVAGGLIGLVAPSAGSRLLALALVGVYGLMRVYAPPGWGGEAMYVLVFGAAALAAVRVAGPHVTAMGAVLTIALGALGVLLGDAWLDEHHASALRGKFLPMVVVALAWTPLLADGLVGIAVRSAGRRAALAVAMGLGALVATAKPLSTAPLVEDLVTGVPPPAGTPDVIVDLARHDPRRPPVDVRLRARTRARISRRSRPTRSSSRKRGARPAGRCPGHASMLTGLYPSRHGAHLAGGWICRASRSTGGGTSRTRSRPIG